MTTQAEVTATVSAAGAIDTVPWSPWAPPLNPPHDGSDGQPVGLDAGMAADIGTAYWDLDPHLCAALQWEAYAATLPPTQSLVSVATGSQSVMYGRQQPVPTGEFGLAVQRALWHRSFTTVQSVPLSVAPPPLVSALWTEYAQLYYQIYGAFPPWWAEVPSQ